MKRSTAIQLHRLSGLASQISGLALGLTFASAGIGAEPEPPPPARVGVYAKHVGSKIVYYYRVTNKSKQDITAVSIGYNTGNDEYPGNDTWELTELPSGWNPKIGIPATSSNSPTGWRVSMTTPGEMPAPEEGIKTHAITWEIINNKSPVIGSWQTMAKMSIALDKADVNYLTGHALVTFSDDSAAAKKDTRAAISRGAPAVAKGTPAAETTGTPAPVTKSPPLNITVPIEVLDTSPPTIIVNTTPGTIWSADDKHIPVNVTFATKEDDFDNLPEMRLESITANEPLEPDDIRDASYGLDDRYLRLRAKHSGSTDRIYTVIYSATDASGNQTTASATITVPATAPETAPAAAPATAPAPVPVPTTAPQG